MILFWPLLVAIGSMVAAEQKEWDDYSLEAAAFLTNGIIDETNSELAVQAHDLIASQDLEGITEYASTAELADAAADYLFKQYPVLDPMNEDRVLLKFQLEWIISTKDRMEIKGVMKRYPKYFKPFNTRFTLFRKILKDQFAKMSKKEKNMVGVKSEEEMFDIMLKAPFVIHLAKKIGAYNKRGLNSERRKKEIRKKELELFDQWGKVIIPEYRPFLFHHLWKKEQKTGQRIYTRFEDTEELEEFFKEANKAKSSRMEEKGSTKRDDEDEEDEEKEEEEEKGAKKPTQQPAWLHKWEEWKKESPERESIVREAYELVTSEDLPGILNYASTHEIAEVIVEGMRKEYPALDVYDENTVNLIKLQVAWWMATDSEEAREVIGRFKLPFAQLLSSFTRLLDLTEKLIAGLSEEDMGDLPHDPVEFMRYTVASPVVISLAHKMVYLKENNWSREQIDEVIRDKQLELMTEWRSSIEARLDPETLHAVWKKEQEEANEQKEPEKRKWNEEL